MGPRVRRLPRIRHEPVETVTEPVETVTEPWPVGSGCPIILALQGSGLFNAGLSVLSAIVASQSWADPTPAL